MECRKSNEQETTAHTSQDEAKLFINTDKYILGLPHKRSNADKIGGGRGVLIKRMARLY